MGGKVDLFKENPSTLLRHVESIESMEGLELYLMRRNNKRLEGLRNAITKIKKQQGISFWKELYPAIVSFLKIDKQISSIHLLPIEKNANVRVSHEQMRFILANAFFLNIKNQMRDGYGFFDFGLLMMRADNIGEERLKCLLAYFVREMKSNSNTIHNDIIIERFYEDRNSFPNWINSDTVFQSELVSIHDNRIEDVVGTWNLDDSSSGESEVTIVDFANCQIHIGYIAPSMTQEEVLFSCTPECFLCLVLCEQLLPEEVVIVKNVRRSCEYTGFLYRFEQKSILHNAAPMNVLALDASNQNSFHQNNVIRDLNKAWIGFKHSTSVISTGHWGCGAFGGDQTFKFLQQICASTLLDKKLFYSTFKDEPCKVKFQTILDTLSSSSITIGQITHCLLSYKSQKDETSISFTEYFNNWLENNKK